MGQFAIYLKKQNKKKHNFRKVTVTFLFYAMVETSFSFIKNVFMYFTFMV